MNEKILELDRVSKVFNGFKAVDRVSMTFSKGKTTSIIGPNGAGKTTIFDLIGGFISLDEGRICYREQRIDSLAPWKISGMGIGRTFQEVRAFDKLTVLENVLLANHTQAGENPVVSILLRKKIMREEASRRESARKWLEIVGLANKMNVLAGDLSYGQQKLLSIAKLLAGSYDVLLLDEPTAGLYPTMSRTILGVIRKIVEEGKTAIVIEHNMKVVAEMSDVVYFIYEGRTAFSGTPEQVLENPQVREAYIGI